MGLSRDGSADRRTTTLWAWEARWWASPPTVMPAQALSWDQRAVTSGRRTRSAATRATCGNSSTTASAMGSPRTAVAPVAIDVGLDRRPQVPPVVVGPQLVLEDHLGVGALPEQEVARALFAGGPHEEVDVRHPRLGQVPGHGALVDRPRPEPPAGDVLGDALHSIPDLGPAPVVHAEVQGEAGVVPRQLLRRLELPDHRAPEPGSSTHPAHPYPPVVELVATPSDDVTVEAHEETHLVGAALPVLGREGVGRQVPHAHFDGTGDDVEQRGLTGLVALGPRQTPRVGPAAVAVHDDGDVARHPVEGDGGRSGTGRVGKGWRVRARTHRSTIRRLRIPRSRCHWRKAAVSPLPSRRCRGSESSATTQFPASRAARRSRVSGAGAAEPGGRHPGHTAPPATTWKPRCGPGAPHLAQSWKLGAHPATASARRR